MSRLVAFAGAVLLAAAGSGAEAAGPVHVQLAPRPGRVGQPVTATFWLSHPGQVQWQVLDQHLARLPGVVLLQAGPGAATGQHAVVFTLVEAGRHRLGPLPVVLSGAVGPDTLYAPLIDVQYAAEPLRTALHPLRPGPTVGQSLAAGPWGWVAVGALLVAGGFVLGRYYRSRPAATRHRQLLAQLTRLEQRLAAGQALDEPVAEQLTDLLRAHLGTGAPVAEHARLSAALGALSQVRFAPLRPDAAAQRQLVASVRQAVAELPDDSHVLLQQPQS
ncbi:hypothetical protein LJ737_15170 [Hymenobacter sp. 15J16-1T3B]|uniref:hypothetical protein n=1 Tax=Hymenobacter sp. 15J16-1T3B TaxID=2886941 RepID=UPI001D119B92|nr:hypothetical protein [Hymenobacter sp. 15J16-1T3B]MCC3158589.1 hypothetical protein [Hymenobacter sp. 15J16-1T3B]